MNKNLSLGLNIILLLAVAVLYYLHFSSGAPATADTTDGTITPDSGVVTEKPVVLSPRDIKPSKIVYVNLDILNENYEYIKEVNATARMQQSALEKEYQTKGQKLQDDYMAFQQKAQAGLLSENQINAEQESFEKRKGELDQLELRSQDLMDKMQQRSDEMNTSIKEYLKEYNKTTNYHYVMAYSAGPLSPVLIASDSLDITQEILDGLNAQYRATKGKKK